MPLKSVNQLNHSTVCKLFVLNRNIQCHKLLFNRNNYCKTIWGVVVGYLLKCQTEEFYWVVYASTQTCSPYFKVGSWGSFNLIWKPFWISVWEYFINLFSCVSMITSMNFLVVRGPHCVMVKADGRRNRSKRVRTPVALLRSLSD